MRYFTSALLLLATCILISCGGSPRPPTEEYKPTPYTKFYLPDGTSTILGEYKGKYLALLFWAASCSASHRSITHFNEEGKRFAGRKDIKFIAVSLDDNRDQFMERITAQKLDAVTQAYSGNGADDEAALAFGAQSLPTAILIHPDGEIEVQGKKIDLSALEGN